MITPELFQLGDTLVCLARLRGHFEARKKLNLSTELYFETGTLPICWKQPFPPNLACLGCLLAHLKFVALLSNVSDSNFKPSNDVLSVNLHLIHSHPESLNISPHWFLCSNLYVLIVSSLCVTNS